MQIKEVFKVYQTMITNQDNTERYFKDSGMKNVSEILDYGFFPLGSGILNNQSEINKAEIEDNLVMVLGNDFGTLTYLNEKCKNNREPEANKTICNLKQLGLNLEQTFFTNLFLGVRNNEKFTETTNIKKTIKFSKEFKEMCYNFFLVQLELISPSIIICLGKEVGKFLAQKNEELTGFSLKNTNFINLFTENKFFIQTKSNYLGNRKFILIPHPSYAHVNWTEDIKNKIKNEINC